MSQIKTAAFFEDIHHQIVKALISAKKSVKISVAWINSDLYSGLLNNLYDTGIQIEIMCTDDRKNMKLQRELNPKIPVLRIVTNFVHTHMHNKFCIIDDRKLITGSYNWSRTAPFSFENIVVIENDFHLIKDYLHEFEDLKNYYQGFLRQRSQQEKCSYQALYSGDTPCNANSYLVGIIGHESGKYNDSVMDIWKICKPHNHAQQISEVYEQYIQSQLGLDLDTYEDHDNEYDLEAMRVDFRNERRLTQNLQDYFLKSHSRKIHAIGAVVPLNFNEHIKFGEPLEHVVKMLWRDMYYRKVIPEILYDAGDVSKIIQKHI